MPPAPVAAARSTRNVAWGSEEARTHAGFFTRRSDEAYWYGLDNRHFLPPPLSPPARGGEFKGMTNRFLPLMGEVYPPDLWRAGVGVKRSCIGNLSLRDYPRRSMARQLSPAQVLSFSFRRDVVRCHASWAASLLYLAGAVSLLNAC
jgi:hypothetical protein